MNAGDKQETAVSSTLAASLEPHEQNLLQATLDACCSQEGVPAAIATLLAAGIRVWVITGDKQETAINIAISCKLIRYPDSLLICNADSPESAERRLLELDAQLDKAFAPANKRQRAPAGELSCCSSCPGWAALPIFLSSTFQQMVPPEARCAAGQDLCTCQQAAASPRRCLLMLEVQHQEEALLSAEELRLLELDSELDRAVAPAKEHDRLSA